MKFVQACFSFSGNPYCALPRAMAFIRKAMFLARVRMVCMPSKSSAACQGAPPWTEFQYWLEAMGMPLMPKNLFISS